MSDPAMNGPAVNGFFLTLEGGEGSGKTTQVALLKAALEKAGIPAIFTREPGGGKGGDAIRALLLTGAGDKWHPVAESLLFQAARVQHWHKVIAPALAAGKLVVCDRFLDSTIAYQGYARGLGADFIELLHHHTLGDAAPQLTVYLDIDPEAGLARASKRAGNETRFESLDIGFHHLVRDGFRKLAHKEPQRIVTIDASQSAGEVHKALLATLSARGVLS